MLAAGQGQAERALRLAAAYAHLGDPISQPAYALQPADVDRTLAPVRQTLGKTGVVASRPTPPMTLEEAVAYALADVGAATEAT
jgi:hypothetical protein